MTSKTSRSLVVLGVLAAGLAVWFSRRPDQLLHPYVWADEYHVLNRYQAHGPVSAAVAPVKGYFIWPTSFSVAVAAWLDFVHLPQVDYWFATGWSSPPSPAFSAVLPRSVFQPALARGGRAFCWCWLL